MILFASDWARYPTAMVHTTTKNRSWVDLAITYRDMGIENHAFLLALINPLLEHVDPHDPNLSSETQEMIAVECYINPWYFFRECARAPAESGSDAVPVEANRGNIALWWLFFNHIFVILIQIRQTGKSFCTDVLMNYLMHIRCKDTDINLLTKDDNLRRKNITRMKEVRDELPKYLQQHGRGDANNTEAVTVQRLGNTYNTHVPQSSPKQALNKGRGLTTAVFHIDEPPFQPNISIALPAALAAMGAAIERAKAAGAPYGTILTTTAGKRDDKEGKYIYNLVTGAAPWTEHFFDAPDLDRLEIIVRKASRDKKIRVNVTMNHRQLNKTDEWLRKRVEDALAEGEDANRDFFNLWTSGNEEHPLSQEVLERITKSKRNHDYDSISVPHGYMTRWFIPEDEIMSRLESSRFTLSIDPSEAGGGDDLSLHLMDVETLETIAAGTFNETNLFSLAYWICDWFVSFPNITGVIERRSTGAMLLDYLLRVMPEKNIDPFRRLFNTIVNDSESDPERFKEINVPLSRRDPEVYVKYKTAFGYATSGSGTTSRKALYGLALRAAAKYGADCVYDGQLIDQITGLERRNGRIDHAPGEHDDLVIAWLLAHWFIQYAVKLDFYGIEPRRVMSKLRRRSTETDEEAFARQEQEELRNKIDNLYERLADEDDEFVSMRLELELRRLDRLVVLEAGEVRSVDALIRQIKDNKKHKKVRAQYASNRPAHTGSLAPSANQQVYNRPLNAYDLRAY